MSDTPDALDQIAAQTDVATTEQRDTDVNRFSDGTEDDFDVSHERVADDKWANSNE